jgi:hypothetical protein
MDKLRIFIASSARTRVLAEMLRDELQTHYCEATLWSEEGKRQPSATIVARLERATQYDFAVIVLARDDVVVREAGDASLQKTRDNCVFEAGFFVAALGRERCFLVNSVEHHDLPSDFGGLISLPFEEPSDLADREACAHAIRGVSASVKHVIQRAARFTQPQQCLPTLSIGEVFQRERPYSDGGDLQEGQVVVCDLQPMADPELAVQVRRNLDSGTSYHYFLYLSEDAIEKTCQGLQVILTNGSSGTENATDFNARLNIIIKDPERILDDLRRICHTRSLRISFFPWKPQFCFRIHNASDPELARLYLRFRGIGFILWAEGTSAESVWRELPRFFPTDEQECIFVPIESPKLKDQEKQRFEIALDRGLKRYFPGIQDAVKQLFLGRNS